MTWNSDLYETKHSFVTLYGKGVFEWLLPQPGERILDVGCGTGHLTAEIATAGAAVVGIDDSEEMIRVARETYPSVDWVRASATDFAFDEPFDAVFSNAALHWIKPPEDAVRCMANVLKPGGRFVVEMGGKGNMQRVAGAITAVTGIEHPWYFPTVSEYGSLLEAHGLEVRQAMLFDRPTKLEGLDGMRNWVRLFGAPMIANIPSGQLPAVLDEIETRLAPELKHDDTWWADYRRLRIYAVKL